MKKTKEKISEREGKLLNLIRQTNLGGVKTVIQNGEPVRMEEVERSIEP